MSARLATDLPLWIDPPFAKLLPEWAEVRRGRFAEGEEEYLIIGTIGCAVHCDARLDDERDLDEYWRMLQPMINSLWGALMYKEYGDLTVTIFRRQAEAQYGGEPLTAQEAELVEKMGRYR